MHSMSEPTWAENSRLKMVIHHALNDEKIQLKNLTGKDKMALQEEFLEWNALDFDELEIDFADHFNSWWMKS